jgi:transcriptional regulator with XRE-family HTH domain
MSARKVGSKSRLRAAREARGLSQEQAAVAAKISVAWLRQVERDPSLLSPAIAARLLPILGLPPDDGPELRP